MKKLLFLVFVVFFFSCSNEKTVKFAVCTDVHQDLIHDGSAKLSTFIKAAEKENADFIIQLGDFCMPFEKNKQFLKTWNSFEGSKYHVLGNHDMDVSPKIITQQFLGMEKTFYSFDQEDFHFIVLDANFFKSGDQYSSYQNGNYFSHPETRAHIPPVQLEWLKKDLAGTEKHSIVFSHQSLEHWGGIKTREQIYQIFREANLEKKKVIACFSGHDHSDRYREIDGIHFVGLNSMSYAWVGNKLEYSGRFPGKVESEYPNLKYTLPYQDPVFAIIQVNSKGEINIKGVQSKFIPPGPEELGAKNHDFSAKISNRTLYF